MVSLTVAPVASFRQTISKGGDKQAQHSGSGPKQRWSAKPNKGGRAMQEMEKASTPARYLSGCGGDVPTKYTSWRRDRSRTEQQHASARGARKPSLHRMEKVKEPFLCLNTKTTIDPRPQVLHTPTKAPTMVANAKASPTERHADRVGVPQTAYRLTTPHAIQRQNKNTHTKHHARGGTKANHPLPFASRVPLTVDRSKRQALNEKTKHQNLVPARCAHLDFFDERQGESGQEYRTPPSAERPPLSLTAATAWRRVRVRVPSPAPGCLVVAERERRIGARRAEHDNVAEASKDLFLSVSKRG